MAGFSAEGSFDVPIFSPLNNSTPFTPENPVPRQTTPTATPLSWARQQGDALSPTLASTPSTGSGSIRVRISSHKLREIPSPFSLDGSSGSVRGQSSVLGAAGATPGEPAPPPQCDDPSSKPPSAPPLSTPSKPEVLSPAPPLQTAPGMSGRPPLYPRNKVPPSWPAALLLPALQTKAVV